MLGKILSKENGKVYYNRNIIIENEIKLKEKNYYEESMKALIQYMRRCEKNPSEKRWDQYAICKKYLSSKTMGYLSGNGFNNLCRDIRKIINKEKRQLKK